MKTSLLVQIVLCLTVALLTSCTPSSSKVTETPRPIIAITSFPKTLTIDDINVEFSGYKREKEYLTIEICFAPPSEDSWEFDDVIFKIENQEILPAWLISDSETGRADKFSCGSLSYPIELIPNSGMAELSIGQLQTNVDSNERDCDKAQKKLNEVKSGIIITCDLSEFGYDSGYGILEKPETMSAEEADKLVKDAFSDTIQVDWRFSFPFEKP